MVVISNLIPILPVRGLKQGKIFLLGSGDYTENGAVNEQNIVQSRAIQIKVRKIFFLLAHL